ncbi:hypothetical protein Dda_7165 [Drechslerella dactyloides]|uniref:Uncharacterized protein n=1 Tax=Drechslerella dactyloides TaxID=74499 RepID=A0AAD6ITS5_DREDA|nr:hypothetical protein Dda_7165 [Drechslerella dactyloides]
MTRSQHLEIDITDSAILDEPIYIYQRSEKKSDDGVSEPNGSAADEKATGNDGKWAGVPTFMSYMLCCQGAYHPRTVDYSDDAKWIGESGMTIRKLVERAAKVTEERIKESTKELRPTIISRNWYNIDVRYSSYPDSRIDIKAELYSNYVYTVADKKRWADSESVGFFLGVDPEDTLRYYY